jgi:hypothetical protein
MPIRVRLSLFKPVLRKGERGANNGQPGGHGDWLFMGRPGSTAEFRSRPVADVIDSRAKCRLRTHDLPFARLDKREAALEVRRDMQG